MVVSAPILDVSAFVEAVVRAVSAPEVVLTVMPDFQVAGPDYPGLRVTDGANEVPTAPLGPVLALLPRLPDFVHHLGLLRSGMALLNVHGRSRDGVVEVLAPELLPVLQGLLEAGVVEAEDEPSAVEVPVPTAADVHRTHWGPVVLPRNPRAAGFALQRGAAPDEWLLLVPGASFPVHLEPPEVPLLVEALAAGRITQGRERSKSSAWVEWTRIELPDRFLRHQRGGGCLGFGGRRAAEVVTYEPYA